MQNYFVMRAVYIIDFTCNVSSLLFSYNLGDQLHLETSISKNSNEITSYNISQFSPSQSGSSFETGEMRPNQH